jgi:hypothetical protein
MTKEANDPPPPPAFDVSSEELMRLTHVLRKIAKGFDAESEERLAIRDASLALAAVFQHRSMTKAYAKLRMASGGRLTEEMREGLRLRGINADELEAEFSEKQESDGDERNDNSQS